jgi:hypothetical protein
MARKEQIQYVRFHAGEAEEVNGVKVMVFEARSKQISDEWVARLRKVAVMVHFVGTSALRKTTADSGQAE